jgi:hypothetical protein
MLGLENKVANACLEGCYTIVMTQVQGWVQILICFIVYLLQLVFYYFKGNL